MSAEAQTIPADILLVAGELVNSTIRNYENNAFANISRDAVAKAILAERERCAQIADAHALNCSSKLHKKRSDHDLAVFESAASEAMSIAASIREGN